MIVLENTFGHVFHTQGLRNLSIYTNNQSECPLHQGFTNFLKQAPVSGPSDFRAFRANYITQSVG